MDFNIDESRQKLIMIFKKTEPRVDENDLYLFKIYCLIEKCYLY